jgi:hypothetical protein
MTTASAIDQIKTHLRLEDLVAETLTLTGKGRTLSTTEHDSLKLRTDWQTWHWYSRDLRGDLFDWYQLQHGCDFRTALTALAQRAGVELTPLSPADHQAAESARQQTTILELAARYYHAQLLSPAGTPAQWGLPAASAPAWPVWRSHKMRQGHCARAALVGRWDRTCCGLASSIPWVCHTCSNFGSTTDTFFLSI